MDAEYRRVVRVFVAHTEETVEERKRLDRVAEYLNRHIAPQRGIVLEMMDWRTHVSPTAGADAQQVIRRQIGEHDVLIAILWKRLGTPTPRADSGTVEEVNEALRSWAQTGRPVPKVYFRKGGLSTETPEEAEQWLKVLQFKDSLQSTGVLTCDYEDPDDFEEKSRSHLTSDILEGRVPAAPESPLEAEPAPARQRGPTREARATPSDAVSAAEPPGLLEVADHLPLVAAKVTGGLERLAEGTEALGQCMQEETERLAAARPRDQQVLLAMARQSADRVAAQLTEYAATVSEARGCVAAGWEEMVRDVHLMLKYARPDEAEPFDNGGDVLSELAASIDDALDQGQDFTRMLGQNRDLSRAMRAPSDEAMRETSELLAVLGGVKTAARDLAGSMHSKAAELRGAPNRQANDGNGGA